jgi:hypothetical protein
MLPVGKRVAALFKELRALNGDGEFIFSTTAGKKAIHHTSLPDHFASIAGSAEVASKGAEGLFQGRDIRRSIETRLQALGVSREVRAQLLSHGRTPGVQQKHYERHNYLKEKAIPGSAHGWKDVSWQKLAKFRGQPTQRFDWAMDAYRREQEQALL